MRWPLVATLVLLGGGGGGGAASGAAAAPGLRLVTYNVQYDNPDPRASLDAIAAADGDVVVLQEVTAPWQHALAARFAHRYPYQRFVLHPTRKAGGLAVLSRLAIRDDAVWPSPMAGWYPAMRVVVAAPFGAVQVLAVHLHTPIDRGSWVRGAWTTPAMRRAEIAAFWGQLARDLPTVIAGDFNEPAGGAALAFLAGAGMARAATAGPPSWRVVARVRGWRLDVLRGTLDHVVLDGRLAASDGRVLAAGTSDHRPVVVTVRPAAAPGPAR